MPDVAVTVTTPYDGRWPVASNELRQAIEKRFGKPVFFVKRLSRLVRLDWRLGQMPSPLRVDGREATTLFVREHGECRSGPE
jgi:hypothetical protein